MTLRQRQHPALLILGRQRGWPAGRRSRSRTRAVSLPSSGKPRRRAAWTQARMGAGGHLAAREGPAAAVWNLRGQMAQRAPEWGLRVACLVRPGPRLWRVLFQHPPHMARPQALHGHHGSPSVSTASRPGPLAVLSPPPSGHPKAGGCHLHPQHEQTTFPRPASPVPPTTRAGTPVAFPARLQTQASGPGLLVPRLQGSPPASRQRPGMPAIVLPTSAQELPLGATDRHLEMPVLREVCSSAPSGAFRRLSLNITTLINFKYQCWVSALSLGPSLCDAGKKNNLQRPGSDLWPIGVESRTVQSQNVRRSSLLHTMRPPGIFF